MLLVLAQNGPSRNHDCENSLCRWLPFRHSAAAFPGQQREYKPNDTQFQNGLAMSQ
jgi:hypothetical protein